MRALAEWAAAFAPAAEDLALAEAAFADTEAVERAGRARVDAPFVARLGAEGQRAFFAHVLDFDDLHLPSTAHISVVCVPAARDAHGYLAAAGVMARLGTVLGWAHYERGWHTTTTAGAPAAAVARGLALGLDADGLETAMALAIPAAGGVQRAFGTDAKALQVAFAVDAGIRAAELVAAGARADPGAIEQWIGLVGGDPARLDLTVPAVPGGLAIKLYPCCYALQRPIEAARSLRGEDVASIRLRTPASTVAPLVRGIPDTGLEAKFSLRYAVAAALHDDVVGFDTFTDAAARRPEVRELAERIEVELTPGGDGLLAGAFEIEAGGRTARLERPAGAPGSPPTPEQLRRKLELCA